MKIDKVYINTHRYDLKLTRICVASIRYWYPDIPIFLIIDYSNGAVNATQLKKTWNVQILETGRQKYGWGFGKFEPLFLCNKERFLMLDADTVFTGAVLDKVSELDADFVVDRETQTIEEFNLLYYDLEEITKLYPDFKYPGYSFNTGQWIGTSNVLRKSDFNDLITWKPRIRLTYPKFFKQADQGLFNLIIHKKEQNEEIKVEKIPLMIWPAQDAADFIQLETIKRRETTYPYIVHWAGMKFNSIREYPRADILNFYENYFYTKSSALEKSSNVFMHWYLGIEKKIRYKFKRVKEVFVK